MSRRGASTTTAGGAIFTASSFHIGQAAYVLTYKGWKSSRQGFPVSLEMHAAKNFGASFYDNALMGQFSVGETKKAGDVAFKYGYFYKQANSMISQITDDDVGTGTGWLAIRSALESGAPIVGVDITPAMLAQAALNAEKVGVSGRVQFALASAMDLPYSANKFDVVLSSLALHHTEVSRSLAEMVRVLRPGGRLAIADMAAPSTWRSAPMSWLIGLLLRASRLISNPRARAEIEAFRQTYTVQEWRGLLAAQGLEKVQVTAILRPGQRFYPGVVFASGEKGAG
jgi:ubiquinone/menaquinone biosynthesis C-methylase UbiE